VAQFDTGTVSSDNSIVRKEFSLRIDGEDCRFLKIRARNIVVCPTWHKGAGGKAWLFLDEVTVQ